MTTFIGKPVTLVGPQLRVGDVAPDFVLMANDLSLKSLKDFGKQTKVISVVPSIDTGICDTQTRRFNQELADRDNTVVITVSADLPLPKNAGVALQVWKMLSPCLITMTMPLVNPTVCSCGSGICWRVRSLSSMPTMRSST